MVDAGKTATSNASPISTAKTSRKAIEAYLAAGERLTLLQPADGSKTPKGRPLNVKAPYLKNWTTTKVSKARLLAHKGGVGLVLNKLHLTIDVDPRNGGIESLAKLEKDTGVKVKMSLLTAGGGYHGEYLLEEPITIRPDMKDEYPGVDALVEGRMTVHVDTSFDDKSYRRPEDLPLYYERPLAPMGLVEGIQAKARGVDLTALTMKDGERELDAMPEEEVRMHLDIIKPQTDYDSWRKICMILQDWDKDRGLELCLEWAAQDKRTVAGTDTPQYDPEGIKDWWQKGFPGGRSEDDLVTFKSLPHLSGMAIAKAMNSKCGKGKLDKLLRQATELKLYVPETIDKIVYTYVEQMQMQHKVKKPIKPIRAQFAEAKSEAEKVEVESAIDNSKSWCNDWWYFTALGVFWHENENELTKPEGLNRRCHYKTRGTKLQPDKYFTEHAMPRMLNAPGYYPEHKDAVVQVGYKRYYNKFPHHKMTMPASEITPEGATAWATLEMHVDSVFGSVKNGPSIFMQWLAWQVQHPGVKLNWAPFIYTEQGVGKSYFLRLLEHLLYGREDDAEESAIAIITPTSLLSRFNADWKSNKLVWVLEELNEKGQNRHAACEAAKLMITQKKMSIEEKSIPIWWTRNTANVIALTNNFTSLAINNEERRWWIVAAHGNPAFHAAAAGYVDIDGGLTAKQQYDEDIWWACKKQPEQLLRHLLDYTITDEFRAWQRAPFSDHLNDMLANENTKHEGFDRAVDLLANPPLRGDSVGNFKQAYGGLYYNERWICPEMMLHDIGVEKDTVLWMQRNGKLKTYMWDLGRYVAMGQVTMGVDYDRFSGGEKTSNEDDGPKRRSVWKKVGLNSDLVRGEIHKAEMAIVAKYTFGEKKQAEILS